MFKLNDKHETLQGIIDKCPFNVSLVKNRPLTKLAKTLNLNYHQDIPTTRQIHEYPLDEIIIKMEYSQPKIFFDKFRVWIWTGWNNRNDPNANPRYVGFSPGHINENRIDGSQWSIEILKHVSKELIQCQN